jgi:DcmR-like sensory protein
VAHPANQHVLHLQSAEGTRGGRPRTAGFPLRLVAARGLDDGVSLGIGAVRLRVGDHAALLYLTPEERRRGLVAAVNEGLRAGDRIVHVVNDLPVATWARAVAASGVDVAARVAEGRLALVSSDDVFFRGGRFEPGAALARLHDLAAPIAGRRARLFVDMTYLLADVPGIERGLELEARVGDALRGLPLVRISAFDAGGEISDRLADVLRNYPTVIGAGGSLWNPYYRPWNELRTVRKAAHLARPTHEAK